jgi:curved DNA-binding protein CbpA
MDIRGYYAILGIPEDSSFQEIRKSYRKLAKKYHPDRNKSSHAEETIKKINEHSKFFLTKKRKQYDLESSNIFDQRIQIMKRGKFIKSKTN